jgi:AraC-like DNA-binding protein
MLSCTGLAARPGFTVTAVTCDDDHRGWSTEECPAGFRIVLVRRGRFRRRADGTSTDLDPTVGYLSVPGTHEQFAHPSGGDVCTSITFAAPLWRSVAGETRRPPPAAVYLDGVIDLTHRRVLAAARAGDVDYAAAEGLVRLLAAAVTRTGKGTPAGVADRRLVAPARAAIIDGHPDADGLLPLAASLGVSPYRLSRAFTRDTGVSLTRYRNRVRVARAMDRLEAGETRLAALAADLGFADQAHLCRTIRAHVGHTPTALRRLLEAVNSSSSAHGSRTL